MSEMIFTITMLVLAIIMFVLGCLQFKEKGFPLNNLYLYAPKEEREKMDKKPYYRQSAIVFTTFGILFLLMAVASINKTDWIFYAVGGGTILLLIYAVVSSAKM